MATKVRILRNPKSKGASLRVAALGNFDGFHIGHNSIISEVVSLSQVQNAIPTLISFYPHPRLVLGKEKELKSLSNLHLDSDFLYSRGIQEFFLFHFTKDFSELTATEFIRDVLVAKCGVNFLIIGPDARIGKNREGDPAFIDRVGSQFGLVVKHVLPDECQGTRVSSSELRKLVSTGNLDRARMFLGRPYTVSGRVGGGAKRGRELGFPTANLHIPTQALPPNGVYSGIAKLGAEKFKSVCNVGVRPTFDGAALQMEVHLMGYTGKEFYKERLAFSFVKKLRDEKKFASKEELMEQIKKDIFLAISEK